MISKKIVLTGCFGVGKTSLFNQFLYQRFSEKNVTTIGVKVDKKVVDMEGRQVSMLIWDIAGEIAQDKVPQSYFLGSSAVIYVFDISRPNTWASLKSDIEFLEKLVSGALIKIVGNKLDLVTPQEREALTQQVPTSILTSAKTGENVEKLFLEVAASLIGLQH